MQRTYNMRRREPGYTAMERRMLRHYGGDTRKMLLLAFALGYYAKQYEGATVRVSSFYGHPSVEVYTTKTDDDMRIGPSWHRLQLSSQDWSKVFDSPQAKTRCGGLLPPLPPSLFECIVDVPSPGQVWRRFKISPNSPDSCIAPYVWLMLGEIA